MACTAVTILNSEVYGVRNMDRSNLSQHGVKLQTESSSPHAISPLKFIDFEQLPGTSKITKLCDSGSGLEKLNSYTSFFGCSIMMEQ
ncbi:hypothetical protein C5167_028353 [Papaver somniferum]|nr:hypothetical protein C5167_028353 [Papaver somniferum]